MSRDPLAKNKIDKFSDVILVGSLILITLAFIVGVGGMILYVLGYMFYGC